MGDGGELRFETSDGEVQKSIRRVNAEWRLVRHGSPQWAFQFSHRQSPSNKGNRSEKPEGAFEAIPADQPP